MFDRLNDCVRTRASDEALFESPETHDLVAAMARMAVNRFVGRYPRIRERERDELLAEGMAHAWKTRHRWLVAPNPAKHLAVALGKHTHHAYFEFIARGRGGSRKDAAELRQQGKSLPSVSNIPEDADFLDQRERPQWLLDLVFDKCLDRIDTRIVELRLMGYRPAEVARRVDKDKATVNRRLAALHERVKHELAPIFRSRKSAAA